MSMLLFGSDDKDLKSSNFLLTMSLRNYAVVSVSRFSVPTNWLGGIL